MIMRSSSHLATLAVTTAVGFFLFVAVLVDSGSATAQTKSGDTAAVELPPAGGPAASSPSGPCTCPGTTPGGAPSSTPDNQIPRNKLWPKPALADLKATLDETDAIAALEALQLALSEVGDGATYIWHRRHGRLSGAVKPTSSFKEADGQICRHIVVALTSGDYSRKAEGIACRSPAGVWTLAG